MSDFIGERRAALESLDEEKIRAYLRKYRIRMPSDETTFWAAVHKARVEIGIGTAESLKWLKAYGYTTLSPRREEERHE